MDPLALETALARAAAAWPGVVLDAASFGARLEACAAGEDPAKLRVEDLFLALACARGDAAALRAFEGAYGGDVERSFARFRNTGVKTADDVKQELRQKLFAGDSPKILEYSGRGELRTWLRVTVTRMLINVTTRETKEQPTPDELFTAMPVVGDTPEAEHLRRTYAAELKEAFGTAVAALPPRDRNLLHYACVEDLGIDAIGQIYGVHRATAARWLEGARADLFKQLRAALLARLKVSERELQSIVRMMLSRVELTLERYLRA